MGLSGRKTKQRIGKDPRNLSWADDASRFGQAYLEKFGWDASKGLGVSGEGRTSAIKATQKLDMLGIGMRHQGDLEGGIAWRQNRDFEDLLRRLNDGTTAETANPTELLDSFHKARAEPEPQALEDGSGGNGDGDVERVKDDDGNGDGEEARDGVRAKKEKKKKKKRKATAEEEEAEEREGLDGKQRKKKKRKKSSSKDGDDDGRAPVPSSIESEPPSPRPSSSREAPPAKESGSVPMGTDTATATRPTTAVTAPVPVRAPPRTHRARIIAAKRMAASNSIALAEILGIPSSSSSSAYPSAVASPLPLPLPSPALATTTSTATTSNATTTPEAKDLLQTLTTSSQSVGDYFKAKLDAKAHGGRQARPTSGASLASTRDDDDDNGRAGFGFGSSFGFRKGASRIPPPDGLDEEPVRGGIGALSSSMFATMFMPRQPTTNAREENNATAGVEVVVSRDASECDDDPKKSEKIRAKEERRRKKEERRQKRAEAGPVDRVAVDAPVDGASSAARSKKKHREPEASDGRLEDSDPSGAEEVIATKKRKKDKKSSEHRRLEE